MLDFAGGLGVADSVVCPGVVPHSLIRAFYVHASVAVAPSFSETFGLPVREAMSCWCPLVTSEAGAVAELAQQCAVLVDPYSVESIANGMARILEDVDLRDRMMACRRVRAQAFTLKAQASSYLRVLEEVARA
jgi:glycosyltransferase involved in cell wall biosynthesis